MSDEDIYGYLFLTMKKIKSGLIPKPIVMICNLWWAVEADSIWLVWIYCQIVMTTWFAFTLSSMWKAIRNLFYTWQNTQIPRLNIILSNIHSKYKFWFHIGSELAKMALTICTKGLQICITPVGFWFPLCYKPYRIR